jgi:signal transduction histidine kinase
LNLHVTGSSRRSRLKNVAIPLILTAIIAFSIIAVFALNSLRDQQNIQLVNDSAEVLRGDLSDRSFYVSQLAGQHVLSVEKVTEILSNTRSFQMGEYDRVKHSLDAAKQETHDIVDSFFVLDKDGIVQYSTADTAASKLIGTSLANHDIYLTTKDSKAPFISSLTHSVVDNAFVFYVASPIIDQITGEFKGTLSAVIRVDTFAKSIEKITLSRPSELSSFSLIDPEGSIMYAGASDAMLGKNLLSEEILSLLPSGIRFGFESAMKEAVAGKTGIYEINLADHPELNNSTNSINGNPIDLALISYTPVRVNDEIVMISLITKSASLQATILENERITNSYVFPFIYGILGTLTAFAIAIIVIDRKLTREMDANTKELQKSNTDLKNMAEKLKEADIEKEEFSAMITHELKTPLVPVIGYSELLLDGTLGPVPEKQKEVIRVMSNSASSLSRLISDLLDARKLALRKMKFEMHDVVAIEMVEQSLNGLRPLAQAKGVTLVSKIDKESGEQLKLSCDAKRIGQVLDNLVNNSIKFAPANTGKVEVSVKKEAGGETIVFTVSDNGVGIPKDKQSNIFRKFYQADTSLTRNVGGTGLGLAISKGIIEMHNGTISFESEPGVGTRFYFSLPLKFKSAFAIAS